ncbi:glucose-6-phosphate 1-dehydrogenase, chloroplastic-like [Ricinus communis]|uniref:glucose-6-phosphate 1-dehydrogenase, chloroplastic-like n=1 Tax=Ricinus communis TaxID=3988 RepID=UPI00201A75DC|nr:glucose-6-phosphate 1-dehydrogenase, chloroplastic-like [Ricinus communis]
MAIRINSCSSSSSSAFSAIYSASLEAIPARVCFSSWNSKNYSKIQQNRHFQIKASNVQPLNAASLRAGVCASSPAIEDVETPAKKLLETEKSKSADLSIIVVGASGELARNKIFPALFALFCGNRLPKNITIFGYARSTMTNEELRNLISTSLTCRIDNRYTLSSRLEKFFIEQVLTKSLYSTITKSLRDRVMGGL